MQNLDALHIAAIRIEEPIAAYLSRDLPLPPTTPGVAA